MCEMHFEEHEFYKETGSGDNNQIQNFFWRNCCILSKKKSILCLPSGLELGPAYQMWKIKDNATAGYWNMKSTELWLSTVQKKNYRFLFSFVCLCRIESVEWQVLLFLGLWEINRELNIGYTLDFNNFLITGKYIIRNREKYMRL